MVEYILDQYNKGEISVLKAYLTLKDLEKKLNSEIKQALDTIQKTEEFQWKFAEVEREGGKYGAYSLSSCVRKTYKFDQYEPYARKKEELKEIEKTLKFVVDKSEKWQTVNDSEGNIIEPIPVSYTTVYTVRNLYNK